MDAIIKLNYTDVQALLWGASWGHLEISPSIGYILALGWQQIPFLEWASYLYSMILEHAGNYGLVPTSSKIVNIYWVIKGQILF